MGIKCTYMRRCIRENGDCTPELMANSVTFWSSAVEFWYEYSETDDPSSQWYRTYGLEHWVGPFKMMLYTANGL